MSTKYKEPNCPHTECELFFQIFKFGCYFLKQLVAVYRIRNECTVDRAKKMIYYKDGTKSLQEIH